ncbi:MAG: DUF4266 domain-containing protein [Pseudomonadota bacterium]|nr:DUF4266 domain-containing protein [Pseudomonadota bacterium]
MKRSVVQALLRCGVLTLAVGMLSACSSLPTSMQSRGVQPWERDILARPNMQLDAAPLDSAYDEHIYFSKDAASGGRGFGGGGCGCN